MAAEMDREDGLLEQLGFLLGAIDSTGRAVIPGSPDELLQSVVAAAAQIFGAAAASIALVDEKSGELVFQVAYGAGQDEVVGMRIPLNKGIAGYVALTGQPIAISNVREDPRFNREFAASTGYVPESILATPLLLGDRVIGVMEVLDKINAPSFGMQDMELLGVFGQQAAIAINQSQKITLLGQAVLRELKLIASENQEGGTNRLSEMLDELDGNGYREAAEVNLLASIYREMGSWGENERIACLKIMSAYAEYVRSKPRFR